MATSLNLCAPSGALCFQRGDTVPFQFLVKDAAGVAVNITGYQFLLTVDPSPEPVDNTNNLFQLSSTIIDGPNGVVQFEMSAVQSDQTPGEYYFDLQMTDGASKIRTILKGTFTFDQDITK